jgi:Ca2+-binding EF-hand superfamily protein
MRARGVRVPEPAPEPALTLPEVRAALGRESDPALLRKLKTASDERADRLVTRSAARAVWRRHATGVAGAAEKEAMRDFDDGFGRDLLELQHTRGSTVGGATSRGARREAPAVAVNPEHAFRDGFGPPGGPHATASIEAALREKLEARGVSGERAFRLLFDREGRGWVDRASLADALHRFNIPASEAEVDALVARYDGAGDGARIGAADFCERLLAPDFPTAAEKEKRRADGVVSAFRRAFKDEVSRHRGDGIGEDDDAATVSTRDALSAAARAAKAAKCRTLGASAARAAAATSLTDSGHVRVEAFVSACQRSIREAEALALKHAPFREPTGFEALGGEHYAPVSARTPPPFPAKPDVARFLRMARDKFAERVPLKGASETTKCARLFDPDRLGYVTPASFRRAMATLGLDAIDEETFAKTFARVAKETETVTRNAASAVCGTSAFVRAFLPARVAVDRPARNAVLAALEQSEAATEAEVRAVLEACDVDVEDPARVARLVRLSRRNGKNENENENEKRKLDYAKLAGMVSQPEPRVRKATSPTPVVDHCTTDLLEIWDASPPSTPSFPPTPPFATD